MIGFLKGDPTSRDNHMEFPFATERDHPRFTVEQSVVIRSGEARKRKEQKLQKRDDSVDMSDDFDFESADLIENDDDDDTSSIPDITPSISVDSVLQPLLLLPPAMPLVEESTNNNNNNKHNSKKNRRGSIGGAVGGVKTGVRTGLKRAQGLLRSESEKAEQKRQVDTRVNFLNAFDPYHSYYSNGDVVLVKNRTTEQYEIEESTLVKPPPQDINESAPEKQGSSFTKTVSDARHEMHKMFNHAFNDKVYKIDKNLYSSVHNSSHDGTTVDSSKKTPYQIRADENNRILQIQKYSHSNQLISRISGIIQPMIETLQVGLYLGRTLFNLFTWQDPILSFWICFLGTILVILLYIAPFRWIFGVAGVALVGPQNWIFRLYQEQLPGYQPPDFNKIVKKKRIAKKSERETQKEGRGGFIFSSTSPGGNMHGFADPKELRSVVVPCSVLKYSRFYEWPPEAEYARVYEATPEDILMEDVQQQQTGGGGFGVLPTVAESDEDPSISATTQRESASRTSRPIRHAMLPGRFRERIGAIKDKAIKQKTKRIAALREKAKQRREKKNNTNRSEGQQERNANEEKSDDGIINSTTTASATTRKDKKKTDRKQVRWGFGRHKNT
eukprot:scaffold2587_cov101-Cylindrotheca_fusiformis.AAC.4